MQLFKKKSFALFLKSQLNFEHFGKNVDPHSLYISEFKDCQIPGSINV